MRTRIIAYAAILAVTAAIAELTRFRDLGSRFAGTASAIHFARVAPGDDPLRAFPGYDDSAWPETLLYDIQSNGPVWIRRSIEVAPHDHDNPLALYLAMVGSVEVFWDGVLIGRSGAIDASGAVSAPGPMDNFFSIDRSLRSPGPHLLAIRVAPGTDGVVPLFHGLALGDSTAMLRVRLRHHAAPIAGLGVFAIIGIYYLAIWLNERRRRDLLFALLCFSAAMLVVVESWRWMMGMNWDWQVARLRATDALTFAVAWLLPTFFAADFRLTHVRRWAAGFAGVLILVALSASSFDERCLQLFAASVVLSAFVLVEAAPLHRRNILPAAVGIAAMAVALATGGYGFNDYAFFIAFAFLILCLLISMTVQMKKQRKERDDALLRAARLEIELLQKSLQPHFLMNTLTAVMEWIEQDPATGVRFLQALAEELRAFSEVANEKLIPVNRELELCRAHLEIMSCRKETKFLLETSGIRGLSMVPPATFHTLLENAITHNRYEGEIVTFSLHREQDGLVERYTLDAPLQDRSGKQNEGGLGLRYIRTRLEESFPGRWRLVDGEVADVWRTVIEVPA